MGVLVIHLIFLCHHQPITAARFKMDPSDSKAYSESQLKYFFLARESNNPVFLNLLISRSLVVLARSGSCQPSIYGRSVFNLQKRALPEYSE